MVDFLLNQGANPNEADAKGVTFLQAVFTYRLAPLPDSLQERLWERLVAAGANPVLQDHTGNSAHLVRLEWRAKQAAARQQP